jgi:hydroxypyruvate isomerase
MDVDDPEGGEISKTEGPSTRSRGRRELAKLASPGNVTLVLEQLNTRDDSHPMKGHPGYQGDGIDYCAEIVRRVDSPRVELRFDVCHAAILNGDVIACANMPGEHIHVAGVPGRGEPDGSQQVHRPAVMRALPGTGYRGCGFIPAVDPSHGLAQAVRLCEVPPAIRS